MADSNLNHPRPPTPPNCRSCGVCCFSESSTYVRVSGDDWSRLGPAADRLAHFVGHRAFMRMQAGHCLALDVRRTGDGSPDFVCSIYEQRPELCRSLGRGSPACAGELAGKGAAVAAAYPTFGV